MDDDLIKQILLLCIVYQFHPQELCQSFHLIIKDNIIHLISCSMFIVLSWTFINISSSHKNTILSSGRVALSSSLDNSLLFIWSQMVTIGRETVQIYVLFSLSGPMCEDWALNSWINRSKNLRFINLILLRFETNNYLQINISHKAKGGIIKYYSFGFHYKI